MGNSIAIEYMRDQAERLQKIEMPAVVQENIAQLACLNDRMSLFDLYVRRVAVDFRKTRFDDIESPEEEPSQLVRFVLTAEHLAGKTIFLKAIFCSLALKKDDEEAQWWYLPYGISGDMYPLYLTASEIDKVQCSDFLSVIIDSIKETVAMRRASDYDIKRLAEEISHFRDEGKLLLLIDDYDQLTKEKQSTLNDFLEKNSNVHAIITSSWDCDLPGWNHLMIPHFSATEAMISRFAEKICCALGGPRDFRLTFNDLTNYPAMTIFSRLYITTPIELIAFIVSSFFGENGFDHGRDERIPVGIRLESVIKSFLSIRQSYMSDGFRRFVSKIAFEAAAAYVMQGKDISAVVISEEDHSRYETYVQLALDMGLLTKSLGSKLMLWDAVSANELSPQYWFDNRHFQAWFVAECVADEWDLSWLPSGEVLFSADEFWTDFMACLFSKEPNLCRELVESRVASLTPQNVEYFLLFFWKIGWTNVNAFKAYSDIALRYFFEKENDDYWKNQLELLAGVIANLLKISERIEDVWIDRILGAYHGRPLYDHHMDPFEQIFKVLLDSPFCSDESKEKISLVLFAVNPPSFLEELVAHNNVNTHNILDRYFLFTRSVCHQKRLDKRFISKLSPEAILFVEDTMRKTGSIFYGAAYAEVLLCRHGGEKDLTRIVQSLLETGQELDLAAIAYLICEKEWGDEIGDVLRPVIERLQSIVGTSKSELFNMVETLLYERILTGAIERYSLPEELRESGQKLAHSYASLCTTYGSCERIVTMCDAFDITQELFSDEDKAHLRKEFVASSREDRFAWGKLLLISKQEKWLIDNPCFILEMFETWLNALPHTSNSRNRRWLCDIIEAVIIEIRGNLMPEDDLVDRDESIVIDGRRYSVGIRKAFSEEECAYLFAVNEHATSDVEYFVKKVWHKDGKSFYLDYDSDAEDCIEEDILDDLLSEDGCSEFCMQRDYMRLGYQQYQKKTADMVNDFVKAYEIYTQRADWDIQDGVLKGYCGDSGLVVIPADVRVIDTGAFRGCDHLKGIYLTDSVQEIRECAFVDCEKLSFLAHVRPGLEISKNAFSGCSSYMKPAHRQSKFAQKQLAIAFNRLLAQIEFLEGEKIRPDRFWTGNFR